MLALSVPHGVTTLPPLSVQVKQFNQASGNGTPKLQGAAGNKAHAFAQSIKVGGKGYHRWSRYRLSYALLYRVVAISMGL